MKTCFKCGTSKPIDEFYGHSRMADGHLGKCKDCTKADVIRHRRECPDIVRAGDARKTKRRYAANKKQAMERQRIRRAANRLQGKAYNSVRRAITSGVISIPDNCSRCHSSARLCAHHEDYSKPLDVTWLCCSCHMRVHWSKDVFA